MTNPVDYDPVARPRHYCQGGIETIDYIRAKMTLDEFVAYCRGNVIKYVSRSGLKGDAAEDLAKAAWYANRAAEELRKVELPSRVRVEQTPVQSPPFDKVRLKEGYSTVSGRIPDAFA